MDKIIEQIVSLLTTNVKTARGIKQIYNGDVSNIPEKSFPCIIISPQSTEVQTVDSANDEKICTIQISLVLDARKFFNPTSANTLASKNELVDIMEETQTSGMKPKTDTVLHSIRSILDCDNTLVKKADISPIVYYDYSAQPKRSFPTVEANITIIATSILYLR